MVGTFLLLQFLKEFQGPLVSADLVAIAVELDRSVQALARALGSALVLALALATVVWSVMSVKIGKRPVFLMSTLLMFAGTMISSYSQYFGGSIGNGGGRGTEIRQTIDGSGSIFQPIPNRGQLISRDKVRSRTLWVLAVTQAVCGIWPLLGRHLACS